MAPIWSCSGVGTSGGGRHGQGGVTALGGGGHSQRGGTLLGGGGHGQGVAPLPKMVAAMAGMGPICNGAPHPGGPVILQNVMTIQK